MVKFAFVGPGPGQELLGSLPKMTSYTKISNFGQVLPRSSREVSRRGELLIQLVILNQLYINDYIIKFVNSNMARILFSC